VVRHRRILGGSPVGTLPGAGAQERASYLDEVVVPTQYAYQSLVRAAPRSTASDLPVCEHELSALSADSALWPWQPQVRYYLLDMGAFSKDELARRSSLVALLFRLEQQHSPEGLKELLDEVIGWFRQHPGCERLQGLFAELIRETVARRGVKLSESRSLSQMKTNLSTQVDVWREQWLAEGEAKGIAKGVAKGKAEALICLLAERFGAVAPSRQKRIRGARLVTLELWFKRAIVAPDLPSVFNPSR
jgi:hypothetical protein